MMRSFVIALPFFLFYSCSDKSTKTKDESRAISFQQKLPFQLSEKYSLVAYPLPAEDTCLWEWELSKETIKDILISFTPIDSQQWKHEFDHIPCAIKGQIVQNNQEFDYSINAGSWFSISNHDTILYFGDLDQKYKEYFITPRWKPILGTPIDENPDSISCDIEVLKITAENLKRLEPAQIHDFLGTFSLNCKTNIEYAEWSNELLFKVLNKHTKKVLEILRGENIYDLKAIITELENPLRDDVRPRDLIDKIKASEIDNPQLERILAALHRAEAKN